MAERAVAAGSVSNQGFGGWSVYAGYWSRAPHLVLVLCAIVAVRIHEFFPGISVVKPVLTGSIGGMLLLYQRTHASVRKMLPESRIARAVFAYFAAIVATSASSRQVPPNVVASDRGTSSQMIRIASGSAARDTSSGRRPVTSSYSITPSE